MLRVRLDPELSRKIPQLEEQHPGITAALRGVEQTLAYYPLDGQPVGEGRYYYAQEAAADRPGIQVAYLFDEEEVLIREAAVYP